jgi:hypothetical protein
MGIEAKAVTTENRRRITLDTWAVLAAFLAAILVHAGVLKHIPW